MAIQLLKSAFLCSVLLLFAGCEKWADGVVREIEFPEHEPEIAATVVLTSGDTEAVACLYQSVSNLTDQQSNIPSGVSARILKDGVEVLSWAPGDTGWIGQEWDKRMMHVIGLDAPLDLPQGAYALEVTAPGLEELTATAVQPPKPTPAVTYSAGVDTLYDTNDWSYGEEKVRDVIAFDLVNSVGQRDVYGIQFLEGDVQGLGDTAWYVTAVNQDDMDLDPRITFNSACACYIIDDQDEDGQSLEGINFDRYGYPNAFEDWRLPLRMSVTSMSPGLGEFYLSIDVHLNSSGNFFANPSTVYSNTSSGFGCFGLASKTVYTFD